MRKFLLSASAFLIIPLLAAMVVPRFINWEHYRPAIERQLSAALGLNVQVFGGIDITLLPLPSLSLRSIKARDDRTGMIFAAEHFATRLSLLSLLGGEFHALDAVLAQPVVTTGKLNEPTAQSLATGGGQAGISGNLRFYDAEIRDSDGASLARFDGEIEASRADGILRGNASVRLDGTDRKLQFSLKPRTGSEFDLRMQLEDQRVVARYSVEGMLDIGAGGKKPGFVGRFDALGVFALNAEQAARSLSWRASAIIAANADTLKLDEFQLSLGPKPYESLIKGDVQPIALNRPRIDMRLHSTSMDLDRLMGVGAPAVILPWEMVAELEALLGKNTPGRATIPGDIELRIDETKLAADTIRSVVMRFSSSGQSWHPSLIEADLPGNSHLQIKGSSDDGNASAKSGLTRVQLQIAETSRFSGWIRGEAATDAKASTASALAKPGLSLVAYAVFDAPGIDIPDLTITTGESVLVGSLKYLYAVEAVKPQISATATVKVDEVSSRITGQIKAAFLDFDHLPPFSSATGGKQASPNLDIAVDFARLRLNGFEAGGVTADINRDGNTLALKAVKIADFAGLELEGDAAKTMEGFKGQFHLSGNKVPQFAEAVSPFLPQALSEWWKMSAPNQGPVNLRIEFDQSGAGNELSTNIKADGQLGGTKLTSTGQLFALNSPRLNQINIGLKTSQPAQMLQQFGIVSHAEETSKPYVGEVKLSLTGNIAGGVAVTAETDIVDAKAKVAGRINFANPISPFEGNLVLKVPDIAGFAVAMGANAVLFPAGVSYEIASRILASPTKITLTEASSQLQSPSGPVARIDGEIAFDLTKNQQIAGQLKADIIDARWLSAYPLGFAIASNTARLPPGELWSRVPVPASSFPSVHGDVWIETSKLILTDTLALDEGRFVFRFEPGKIGFEGLEGRYATGRLASNIKIIRQNDEANATAELKLTDVDIDRLTAMPFAGRMSGQVSLSAAGNSAAAIMGSIAGSGALVLKNIRLDGVDAAVFKQSVGVPMAGRAAEATVVSQELDQQMERGLLTGASGEFNLSMANGTLLLGPMRFGSGDGKVQIKAGLELPRMAFNLETRLEVPSPTVGWKGSPPQALITWIGTLDYLQRNVDAAPAYQEFGSLTGVPGTVTGSTSKGKISNPLPN